MEAPGSVVSNSWPAVPASSLLFVKEDVKRGGRAAPPAPGEGQGRVRGRSPGPCRASPRCPSAGPCARFSVSPRAALPCLGRPAPRRRRAAAASCSDKDACAGRGAPGSRMHPRRPSVPLFLPPPAAPLPSERPFAPHPLF